jgi:hypothetical protein
MKGQMDFSLYRCGRNGNWKELLKQNYNPTMFKHNSDLDCRKRACYLLINSNKNLCKENVDTI